ncbi:MAG: dTDP-glucose 4,6-dehydratase [Rhodospirillaceae bacterium]|nr:dTDP-glucose 4,6-dehydratase [Rhodospirillaceae bacterium]
MSLIVVTGGAGFIGANFVHHALATGARVINLDALTYAGNLDSLHGADANPNYRFVQGDIGDRALVGALLKDHRPNLFINFAAESHVDRSIDGPAAFMETNIMGVFNLLEAVRTNIDNLPDGFRMLQVSTDEVYGSCAVGAFNEESPFRPNSPYAASKASGDHLVRAYHRTYGLPLIVTNCSNNYGPYQFPEKLIPLMTLNGLEGKPLPVYGDGQQVRDWLHVEDHCAALMLIAERGVLGETYNIGGNSTLPNLTIVKTICAILDELHPDAKGESHDSLIRYVDDRPGHDARYAVDTSKIERELGWKPSVSFEAGLKRTITWYLEHEDWWRKIREKNYSGARLGLGAS